MHPVQNRVSRVSRVSQAAKIKHPRGFEKNRWWGTRHVLHVSHVSSPRGRRLGAAGGDTTRDTRDTTGTRHVSPPQNWENPINARAWLDAGHAGHAGQEEKDNRILIRCQTRLPQP